MKIFYITEWIVSCVYATTNKMKVAWLCETNTRPMCSNRHGLAIIVRMPTCDSNCCTAVIVCWHVVLYRY